MERLPSIPGAALAILASLAACARSAQPAAATPVVTVAPAARSASEPGPPAPAAHAVAPAHYPVGRACSGPAAVEAEGRTLPPRGTWITLASTKQHLRVRAPPGVFVASDGVDGFSLVSALKAAGLGPEPQDHVFAIRIQRFARSADDLLADRSHGAPLANVYADDAFPSRTTASFVSQAADDIGPGSAAEATVSGAPAWVWVLGVEGYNTDYALVALGAHASLLVVADWNSAIMEGQPECWQRAIIGGVVESLVASP